MTPDQVAACESEAVTVAIGVYAEMQHELDLFMDGVAKWFLKHPQMSKGTPPLVHSVKSRLKDPEHLREKLGRKFTENGVLTFSPRDLGTHVTDLAGVRVLHLHETQFAQIHRLFMTKIDSGDWTLAEKPKAYTWDPESRAFFETLGLECSVKESFYTSVHYVVRPKPNGKLACEIQVRTLFEEVWGEVDHSLKYPDKTVTLACKEQLRVLSKVVGAGSRLVDSIYRTNQGESSDLK
jgi:ppGpp synthetase/RelA/SpoT-type nucleotidyltranferase